MTSNPRVSGLIPSAVNLKKLFIWMKIYGLKQTDKAFVQIEERATMSAVVHLIRIQLLLATYVKDILL